MSKNHFAVLGLKPGATEDDIKKSFRSLAKQWHPDKNKTAGAEEKFKEISAAYDFLQSKDRREILQRDLNREREPKKTESYTYSTFKSTKTTYSESPKPKAEKKENKDPGKSKKDDHWSSSFFGKNKQKRKPEKKEQTKGWEGTPGYKEERTPKFEKPPPTFSDAFRSFVDHLDSEFDTFFEFGSDFDNPLFNRVDPFADLYAQGAVSTVHRPKKKKPPARPRHVAPERGKVEGLNEEYLFSPRQGSQSKEFQFASDESDLSSDGEFGYDADKAAAKAPCHLCGKLFQAYKLIHHEQNCGKFDHDSDGEPNIFSPPGSRKKSTGDWRQSSNQLHSEIRRAKQAARTKVAQESYATVFCKWCGQSFNKQTAERHVPSCERSAKRGAKNSRTEKAKEYAKEVPRPGVFKTEEPTSSHTYQNDSSDDDMPFNSYSRSSSRFQPTPKPFSKSASHSKQSHTKQPHTSYTKQTHTPHTKQPNTKPHTKATGSRTPNFGVSGESVKKRSGDPGNGGCPACKKTFGASAKFACSCGTKSSFR